MEGGSGMGNGLMERGTQGQQKGLRKGRMVWDGVRSKETGKVS